MPSHSYRFVKKFLRVRTEDDSWLGRAKASHVEGNFDRARAYYLIAGEKNPNDYLGLGLLYFAVFEQKESPFQGDSSNDAVMLRNKAAQYLGLAAAAGSEAASAALRSLVGGEGGNVPKKSAVLRGASKNTLVQPGPSNDNAGMADILPDLATTLRAAAHHLGRPLATIRAQLGITSDLDVTKLPDKAPKLYADRPKGQGIVAFLQDREGWGPYITQGVLTRPDLRRLDPQAEMALQNWLRHNQLPEDLKIRTKSDAITAMARGGSVPEPLIPRVGAAIARRRQRAHHKGDL